MTESDLSNYILMGYITKAHGLKGEVRIHLLTEEPKRLIGSIYIKSDSSNVFAPYSGLSYRMHHGLLLLTIEGITDRTKAESLQKKALYIHKESLPLDDEAFYITELLNLPVYIENFSKKSLLGNLENIDSPAGQELWTIKTIDNKEVLLPAVDEFIKVIDLDEGYIIITPPPGLIELFLE